MNFDIKKFITENRNYVNEDPFVAKRGGPILSVDTGEIENLGVSEKAIDQYVKLLGGKKRNDMERMYQYNFAVYEFSGDRQAHAAMRKVIRKFNIGEDNISTSHEDK